MLKKLVSLFIIIGILFALMPAVHADGESTVKADKSIVRVNDTVTFTVTTSASVKKLQTVIDGKKGSTYTKYTKKNNQRTWKIAIRFNKTGRRSVQFLAFTSGGKTTIPNKPCVIQIQKDYDITKPSTILSGEPAVFTVYTSTSVSSLCYIIDGKTYPKTSKYTKKSGSLKVWEIPITFIKGGTKSVYFSAYSSRGSRLKKFPSKSLKINVREGSPKASQFQAKDAQVVPFVSQDPTFYVNMTNEASIALKIYNKDGAEVATLASGLKLAGQKSFSWDVTDEGTRQPRYPMGDYTVKLNAKNNAGEMNAELPLSLLPLNNPLVTSPDPFVVAFDMASLSAAVKNDGNVLVSDAGFYFGTSPDHLDSRISLGKINEGSGYSKLMTGLTPGATYYYCPYAQNIGGLEGRGDVRSFTTPEKSTFSTEDSFLNTVEEEDIYIFNSKGHKYTITSPPPGYGNAAEASLHMKTFSVPVWKISNGQYVSSAVTLKVHRKLAEAVKAVFAEIYAIKFPMPSVYSFCYRSIRGPQACSTLSQHSYGCAIDINASYNPNVVSGDPRNPLSPYTITPAVVEIFKKYGWDWGGNWTSNKDYMHFEYLGTPMAGKIAPQPSPPPSPSVEPSPSEPPPPPEPAPSNLPGE